MKTILRQDIPEDYSYYRTGSRVFYEYYQTYYTGLTERIGTGYKYIKMGRILGSNLWAVIAEKIDTEPTREFLSQHGINHGIIYWVPLRATKKPKGWIRLPKWYVRYFVHSSRSAFSVLDTPEYWNKWSSEARNHRKKVLKNLSDGTIRIEESKNLEEFYEAYKNSTISDPNKRIHMQWCRRMIETQGALNKRIYLGYVGDTLIAGALFIDEGVTSEYYMSFYNPLSRPYQFGIAMMDRWYMDSVKQGLKYCDLDHMWDFGNPLAQRGYTRFKSGIADYDVYFHDMWMRVF